jgi:hypothetical protein
MWKNAVQPERRHDSITQRTRFACWITKATNTNSEYAILTAFPHQHWLHERASVLRYTYVPCLSVFLQNVTTHCEFLLTLEKWLTHYLKIHLHEVKLVLMHAVKIRSGNWDIAPRVLNFATRWRWIFNFTLRAHYSWERTLLPAEYEAGWAAEPAETISSEKTLAPAFLWIRVYW